MTEHETLIYDSLGYLKTHVEGIANRSLRAMCMDVLDGPEFRRCTASRKQHQAYDGGLVVHTAEVMQFALLASAAKCIDVDRDVLVAAVVFHDYGKVFDYQAPLPDETEKYSYTEHQRLIRHLPRSYAMFMQAAWGLIPKDTCDAIGHAILAHHGRREWGSPVEPQTTEAHLLHMADMLSANCAKVVY